jgi:hypothetical protein
MLRSCRSVRARFRLHAHLEPVNLARLIDEVIGTAGQLAEKNKNRLVVKAQEKLGAVTALPRHRSCLRTGEPGPDVLF